MKRHDCFQRILDEVRDFGHICTYEEADEAGVLSIEIDGNVNCTNFLKVRKLDNGSEYNASCIMAIDFLPVSKTVQYWGYEVALDLLFSHYALGYTKVSRVDHFQEYLIYRFLQISQGRDRSVTKYGIAVCSGPEYVKRNANKKFPRLANDKIYGQLIEFYNSSGDELESCFPKERRELQDILYVRNS